MKRFAILVLLVLSACGRHEFPAPELIQQGRFVAPNGDVFEFGVGGVTTQYRIDFAGTGFEFEGTPVTDVYEHGIAILDRGRVVFLRTGVGFRINGAFDGRTLPGPERQFCDATQTSNSISLTSCEDVQPWPLAGAGNWMAVGDLELTRLE